MRILLIARASSFQTAHWLRDLVDTGWDIHLFPVDDAPPHPELNHITLHDTMYYPMGRHYLRALDSSVQVDGIYWSRLKPFWKTRGGPRLARRALRYVRRQWHDPAWRAVETIRALKPDLVHSLGIQDASYFALHTRNLMGPGNYPPWAVTDFGNDVQLMGQLHEHIPTIKAVLTGCDYYFSACSQQAEAVRSFGFEKTVLPVIPALTGFDLNTAHAQRPPGTTSQRRMILLHGYSEWFGRTLVGLRALERCADLLRAHNIRITIANANYDVKLAADVMARRNKLVINSIPYCPPNDLLQLQGQARLSLDVHLGGGLSSAFLEALVMGAFPIQSVGQCASEWGEDGKNALFIPPDDPEIIAEAIRRALTEDVLVDSAVAANDRLAEARLNVATIKAQKIAAYEQIQAGRRV